MDALKDQVKVFGVEAHAVLRRIAQALLQGAVRSVDLQPQVRRHLPAAAAVAIGVDQRRVGRCHLQRRGLQRALAHRQVHVFAHRPRLDFRDETASLPGGAMVGAQAVFLAAVHFLAPLRIGHDAFHLAGEVHVRFLADAQLAGHVLDHVAVPIGALADREEVGVR